MGFIKGGLLYFLSVILLITLLSGNLFLTLGLSLDNDNVKTEIIGSVADNVVGNTNMANEFSESIEDGFPILEERCKTQEEVTLEGEVEVTIPCDIVAEGPDAVADEAAGQILEEAVDEAINENTSGFEISKFFFEDDSKNFWMNLFYLSLAISLIAIGAMFFLLDEKFSIFITLGLLLVVASLPFGALAYMASNFSTSLLSPIFVLLSESYTVFLISIISGGVLFSLGVCLRVFEIGTKVSNFIKKKD